MMLYRTEYRSIRLSKHWQPNQHNLTTAIFKLEASIKIRIYFNRLTVILSACIWLSL